MSLEREGNNRRLAKWIEPYCELTHEHVTDCHRDYSPKRAWQRVAGGSGVVWEPRDFYTSEEANAMLLEKMPRGTVLQKRDDWQVRAGLFGTLYSEHPDRKTAIVTACLAWIENGGGV